MVMRTVPTFLQGAFRGALRLALDEAIAATSVAQGCVPCASRTSSSLMKCGPFPNQSVAVRFPTLQDASLASSPPSPLPVCTCLPVWPSTRRPWPPSVCMCNFRVLGRRGFPLESGATRVCREAGARVRTKEMVRDLDLLPHDGVDNRRLEVVADGLCLHGGAQLAVDTTLVSALARGGSVKRGADRTDGAAPRKEHTHPELAGVGAKLVVFAVEVGGRWPQEPRQFLIALVSAKALSAPFLLQSKAKAGWLHRWSCLLGCTAAKSFALSLLDGCAAGVGGSTRSVHEMLGHRCFVP